MRRLHVTVAATLMAAACMVAVYGQQAASPNAGTSGQPSNGDEAAIRQAAESFVDAFNSGDAVALASHWTLDGDLVDEYGTLYQGRPVIQREYARFFSQVNGAHMEVQIDEIRFPTPGLAVEHGTVKIYPPQGVEHSSMTSRYSAVHVQQNGKWLITHANESRGIPQSHFQQLKGLEWLIGDWIAQAGETQIHISCEWSENRNFIQRNYTVMHGNQKVSSGSQTIGWNPSTHQIASFHHDSEGGHGGDTWNHVGDSWVVHSEGVMRDGRNTTSSYFLTPIDADSFAWRSSNRTAAGVALEDTNEVRVVRAN